MIFTNILLWFILIIVQIISFRIVISFNINHTVDTEDDADLPEEGANQDDAAEMRSKPDFEVDITKGDRTLSFSCSFLKAPPVAGEYGIKLFEKAPKYIWIITIITISTTLPTLNSFADDVFGIEEFSIFQGEITDKTYACAGDVLDGYLYDLLMNLLEEKGISNEFVNKLSDLSTAYEHSTYINLLESLSKFTAGKWIL